MSICDGNLKGKKELTALGLIIGRRTTATDLPQTVAALHSVVGLAAVLTSFGSVMAHIGGADISTLHMVAGYLGVLIGRIPLIINSIALLIWLGGVTFTGSVVAFLKLAGRMSSKPIRIPGPRHFLNSSLLGLNVATMGTFLAMAPGSPLIAAGCLAGNAVLSFLKGYTTTAAIGGADMRESSIPYLCKQLLNAIHSCRYHSPECLLWICPCC